MLLNTSFLSKNWFEYQQVYTRSSYQRKIGFFKEFKFANLTFNFLNFYFKVSNPINLKSAIRFTFVRKHNLTWLANLYSAAKLTRQLHSLTLSITKLFHNSIETINLGNTGTSDRTGNKTTQLARNPLRRLLAVALSAKNTKIALRPAIRRITPEVRRFRRGELFTLPFGSFNLCGNRIYRCVEVRSRS